MPANKNPESVGGPEATCCLGITAWDRTLEKTGGKPTCLGLAQVKRGDQDSDDVRVLSGQTRDFKYVCLGYSSHPTDARPAKPGQPTNMPFCEGVEIAITEEEVAPVTMPGSTALMRDRQAPALSHGDGAGAQPPAASPSDEEGGSKGLQERFAKHLRRNADSLRAAMLGDRFPTLPVQLRQFETLEDATKLFTETARVNMLKMNVMAEFISFRGWEAVVKPIWERFGPSEEAD
ncbi:hypothetical protein HYH02_013359 [Chlamydomonas schloesseri]|uniref:DUF8204 domain-containing protein n=1 Tax=Chlamydomonas schloesseri TaxID=2026947 RepID=A0A835T2P1_9CHLO|nr:hypothetical protein HYH02_013359 [Chlamydomonas schloesseri]|eukprot:KAG2431370.1 hypothetical protein HYH02_013359 [Chlamydomonas schloesseri]